MVTIKEENKKDLNICKRCTHKGICKYEEDALIFANQMEVFYRNNAPKDLLLTYDIKCELFKPDSIDITITDPNDYITKSDSGVIKLNDNNENNKHLASLAEFASYGFEV